MDKTIAPDKVLKGLAWEEGKNLALVVLTGMQEHSLRYQGLAEHLNKLGIDVFVYDLLGQGENAESESEMEDWPEDAFRLMQDSVRSKIEELKGLGKKVCLMGHSCGSFITQGYIERYPASADGYILMGSNGPRRGMYLLAYLLTKLLIGEGNLKKEGRFFESLAIKPYSSPFEEENEPLAWLSVDKENIARYKEDPKCGYPCKNSFWKGFFKGLRSINDEDSLKKIPKETRILILSGSDDPVGEMGKGVGRLEAMYKEAGLANVEAVLYQGYRHEILNEACKDDAMGKIGEFVLA